jgi:hypothetical protein
MKLIKFAQLPVPLKIYAQTVMAADSLEQSKEDWKETALAALKETLNGTKCVVASSNHHFIQFDVNPQQHPEFDAQDESPEIQAIVSAQLEVKKAHAKLAVAVADGKSAGKVQVKKFDSIRVEMLSDLKLIPIKHKYEKEIRTLRRRPAKKTAPAQIALA